MKNKMLVFFVLLFLSSMTLGKGASEAVDIQPEIDYKLSGTVESSSGTPVSGLPVTLEVTDKDTAFISPFFFDFGEVFTNDSGKFNFFLQRMNSFQTGIRIVTINGLDTLRSPWRFVFTARNQETLETFTSNDCYAHKTIAPTNETYIFDPETIVLP